MVMGVRSETNIYLGFQSEGFFFVYLYLFFALGWKGRGRGEGLLFLFFLSHFVFLLGKWMAIVLPVVF